MSEISILSWCHSSVIRTALSSRVYVGETKTRCEDHAHLVNRCLSTEVSDDVPARDKLSKTSVNRQQSFGRQYSLELLIGDHQLVAGIETLRQRSSVQRA